MHSRILTSVAALLTALVVSACGQAATAPTAQEPTTSASTESATTPAEPTLAETSPLTATIVSTPGVVTGSMSVMTGTMPGMEGMDHGAMANPDQPFDAQFIDSSTIEHHQGAIEHGNAGAGAGQQRHVACDGRGNHRLRQGGRDCPDAGVARRVDPDIAATTGMGMAMGDMELGGDDSVPFDRRFMESNT